MISLHPPARIPLALTTNANYQPPMPTTRAVGHHHPAWWGEAKATTPALVVGKTP